MCCLAHRRQGDCPVAILSSGVSASGFQCIFGGITVTAYTFHYDSPLGGITLASDGTAITGLWFDGQKYFACTLPSQHIEKDLSVFHQAINWLDMYFGG